DKLGPSNRSRDPCAQRTRGERRIMSTFGCRVILSGLAVMLLLAPARAQSGPAGQAPRGGGAQVPPPRPTPPAPAPPRVVPPPATPGPRPTIPGTSIPLRPRDLRTNPRCEGGDSARTEGFDWELWWEIQADRYLHRDSSAVPPAWADPVPGSAGPEPREL